MAKKPKKEKEFDLYHFISRDGGGYGEIHFYPDRETADAAEQVFADNGETMMDAGAECGSVILETTPEGKNGHVSATVFYVITRNGDGSASAEFFGTEKEAEKALEKAEEECISLMDAGIGVKTLIFDSKGRVVMPDEDKSAFAPSFNTSAKDQITLNENLLLAINTLNWQNEAQKTQEIIDLLAAGAQMPAQKEDEGTAFLQQKVVAPGHFKVLKALIDAQQIDLSDTRTASSLLISAVTPVSDFPDDDEKHKKTLDVLLDQGLDPNHRTPSGMSLLMIAARRGFTGAIESLVAHGTDVNAKGGVRVWFESATKVSTEPVSWTAREHAEYYAKTFPGAEISPRIEAAAELLASIEKKQTKKKPKNKPRF